MNLYQMWTWCIVCKPPICTLCRYISDYPTTFIQKCQYNDLLVKWEGRSTIPFSSSHRQNPVISWFVWVALLSPSCSFNVLKNACRSSLISGLNFLEFDYPTSPTKPCFFGNSVPSSANVWHCKYHFFLAPKKFIRVFWHTLTDFPEGLAGIFCSRGCWQNLSSSLPLYVEFR